MDEIVRRAMTRWPDVPDCHGWLRLDARGVWWIADAQGHFERVVHEALIAFIGRNYQCDARGRYFFQNGPQRVWVSREYTPHVYRLSDDMSRLVSHADSREAGEPIRLIVDDAGSIVVDCAPGPGVILDRDLAGFVDMLCDIHDEAVEPGELMAGIVPMVRLFGVDVAVFREARSRVPALLAFDPAPHPD